MIQLTITETGKGFSPKSDWTIINEAKKTFPDMETVKVFLKERYGKCKRVKMYQDNKNNESVHCGYIYSFHNADWSHCPVEKWIQRDWIGFNSLQTMKLS